MPGAEAAGHSVKGMPLRQVCRAELQLCWSRLSMVAVDEGWGKGGAFRAAETGPVSGRQWKA